MSATTASDATLRLDGQVAVVTGAARGLGAAHARLLAERGASVVLNDLPPRAGDDSETAVATADRIAEEYGNAVAVTGSITDADTRAAIVATAIDQFGRLDVIVNNAGMGVRHAMGDLVFDHLRLEFDVHVFGALMLIDEAWPHLCERGGAIVSTGSGIGLFGLPGSTGYAAAKMALVGANRVLALEGRPHGIRSNIVAPIADTRMAGGVFGDLTPRLRTEFVAQAVLWLVHPSCGVTGEVISAGGGRVARAMTTVGRGRLVETAEELAASWQSILADEQLELGDALEETELTAQIIEAD